MRQVLIDRTSRIDAIDLWAISPAPSTSRVLACDCSLDSGVVSLVSSSARVVYAALAGDLAVAAAKFGASALSGSSAMLTEAIHSLVDSADQLLLLTGQSRARKPPDRIHPLGYGMETYFWSFVVALCVFFLGGLVAFYQGVRHILTPQPIVSPAISLGVLVVAALFEGWSFAVGFREYKRVVRTRHPLVVLHQGVQRSKSLWDAFGGFLRSHWDRDSSARRHCIESAPYWLGGWRRVDRDRFTTGRSFGSARQ